MPKKDKKKAKPKDEDGARSSAADAVEAVRAVVERTFGEGAHSTRERAVDLITEVASAAAGVRTLLDELRVADDVRALRADIEALSARVTSLERAAAAASTSPAAPAAPARARRTAGTPAKRATPAQADTPAEDTPATSARARASSARAGTSTRRRAPAKGGAAATDAKRTAARTTTPRRARGDSSAPADTPPDTGGTSSQG